MMTYTLFIYLLEATLSLSVFALAYRWLFSKYTHFHWMRFYLIASLLFSLTLPFIHVPMPGSISLFSQQPIALPQYDELSTTVDMSRAAASTLHLSMAVAQPEASRSWLNITLYGLSGVFLLGFLYKIGVTVSNLLNIRRLIQHSEKIAEEDYYVLYPSENLPTFSFWHYIFLNQNCRNLPHDELQQVKQHELVHVRQKHTADLLLSEIIGALFWFNPLMTYLKNALQEVHEYLADATVAGRGEAQKDYARLLLKLAVSPKTIPMVNSFSGKQISRRIAMLTKARSLPKHRFAFTLIFPLAFSLLWLCSCMEDTPVNQDQQYQLTNDNKPNPVSDMIETQKRIDKLIRDGNAVYYSSHNQLEKVIGVKSKDDSC